MGFWPYSQIEILTATTGFFFLFKENDEGLMIPCELMVIKLHTSLWHIFAYFSNVQF